MRMANVMALAVAVASGCATSSGTKSGATTVSDADFGRVQASQMGPVDQARQAVFRARDEQAHARARLADAQHEAQLATADQGSAKAATEQASTMQQIAIESREQARMQQARGLLEKAGAQQRAADARTEYSKRQLDACNASVQAADKQRALADAQLEVAKLKALRESGVAISANYDMSAMARRAQQAQAEHDAAQQNARDSSWWAQQAHRTYEDAQREFRAQASPTGTPPTGTGSGAR